MANVALLWAGQSGRNPANILCARQPIGGSDG